MPYLFVERPFFGEDRLGRRLPSYGVRLPVALSQFWVFGCDSLRHLVKEELVKFGGTPVFPERRAYTVNYKLSDTIKRVRAKAGLPARWQGPRARRFPRYES
jgi:hypothetical protein